MINKTHRKKNLLSFLHINIIRLNYLILCKILVKTCYQKSKKSQKIHGNGSKPYLYTFDLNTLIDDVVEAFDHGTSFDTYELIDRAFEIR